MRRALHCCLGVAGLLLINISSAYADRRVALVIGNGAYQHVPALTNPRQDALAMRETLTQLGFEVVYGENLNRKQMGQTLAHFAALAREADVALAYYAGHGSTFGDNSYLVPIDAEFTSLEGMPYELVSLESVLGELRQARGVRIAIIDACRDNEAERALKHTNQRAISDNRGLARVQSPEGLILAFSTQYGSTAADGTGNNNSPFTAAMLKMLPTPGLDIKDLFYGVGREVLDKTQRKQRPAIEISFYDNYMLVAPRAIPVPAVLPSALTIVPPATDTATDAAFLNLISGLSDPATLTKLSEHASSAVRQAAIHRLAMLPKSEDAHPLQSLSKPSVTQNSNLEIPASAPIPQPLTVAKPAPLLDLPSSTARPTPTIRPKPTAREDIPAARPRRVVDSSVQKPVNGLKRKRCFPFDGEMVCQ